MRAWLSCLLSLVILCCFAGCANITAPTGGKKDITPPKRVSIAPGDSLLNTRVTRVEMHFDEYITVSEVGKELQISPILPVQPTLTGHNKTVILKIVDSLLEENTTYRVSFGSAIRDLHEGNAYPKYTYTFSTGPYFDSMQLSGKVINALTGLPDTGNVSIFLYNGNENDSAIVRKKPRYITRTDASGVFTFKGLPKRSFKIYAVKDVNGNLLYDGPAGGEWVGFIDNSTTPGDTTQPPVSLALFAETPDTATQKNIDSVNMKREMRGKATKPVGKDPLTYSVGIDTSNLEKRTFDLNNPIVIGFNKRPVLNKEKITLTFDSLGSTVTPPSTMVFDTISRVLKITTDWRENMVYKLRLVKGFAKDTDGVEVMPARFTFRTKEDGDYGKIVMHLPTKYVSPLYLLKVLADNDSVYLRPVTDSVVTLPRLRSAKYTFSIIVDKNHDGKWNTGDLLAKRHAEEVIPYREVVRGLRPGFEFVLYFEKAAVPKPVLKGGK